MLEVLKACERAVGRSIPYEIVDPRPGDPPVLVASPGPHRSGARLVTSFLRRRCDRQHGLALASSARARLRRNTDRLNLGSLTCLIAPS